MSVVKINLCDCVAAGIREGHGKFLSIQMNSSQLDVCRDIPEVDSERVLLKNRLVFSENRARQQGRVQRPLTSEPGLDPILVHQDLFQVEVKDVKLIELTGD